MDMFTSEIFTSNKVSNVFSETKKGFFMDSDLPPIDCSNVIADSNNFLINSSSTLTPTSPQSFYLPPKQFSETEYPAHFEVPQTTISTNPVLPINCSGECFDWLDMSSLVDTPNSTTAIKTTKEEIFNFEPEYIEFFHRYCENDKRGEKNLTNEFVNKDIDYFNYNESNCQSKSTCVSPNIDSWMNIKIETSIKPSNALPPISTISEHFHGNGYLEQDEFGSIDKNTKDFSRNELNFNSCESFNFNNDHEHKDGREVKNIWQILDIDTNHSESPTDNMFADEIFDTKKEFTILSNNSKTTTDVANMDEKKWVCEWRDCFNIYGEQSDLVKHIEKTHIEVKKGDVFSCHWLNCTRENKPFNARYKLLIHMRVHSGEKPNKCEVRNSILNIFLCQNLTHIYLLKNMR